MTQAAVTCPKCSTDNPAAARFCMGCGASMEVPCPSCETALPPGAKFCFNCGNEIEAGAIPDDGGRTAQAITSEIAGQLREITATAGERRTITMLFCDVVDSTATAERLDPEEWSSIMHQAMDCFVSSVERYGGTVARLLGDAVLAYFGAPVAHEDDPQRALLAGLTILDCTRDLCERVQAEHGTNLDVRIGVNTGLVVLGEMGSETRNEYAAIGDAANVAARMEQTAEPGTIRVSANTHRLVAPLFDFESVGSIDIKGRSEPMTAWTVIGARGMPGQVRGIEGLTSPLVGRAGELQHLQDAADAVISGSGRIVSVMGEAGLGKSRLVAELHSSLDPEAVHWVTGQCHSYEDTTPYAPFVPALHDCLELDPSDPGSRRAEQVIEGVTGLLGPEGRDQALYLCSLLGLPLGTDDQHSLAFLDPGTLRERVFDAVAALLQGLARRRPVVLELEDLHWADPTSIDLARHLLALADSSRLLLLLLFRPRRDEPSWGVHEAAARGFAHRHVTVALSPLGSEDAEELVANLLRVEGLSDRVRRTILDKSEGNPFFVEEVIRSLLDAGIIVRQDDRFVATEEITDVAVPDTLAAVLATRLDRLEPGPRRVVQTAAVVGREFSAETLRLLVDPEIDLDSVLADLQRRELIVERGRDPDLVFAFKHALTRDTAYDTLLLSVRRDLHGIVGKVVEERHPDRVFDLARHYAEADQPTKAVPYLVEAGEQAFAAFSRADAADLFARAIELWDDFIDIGLARRAYEGRGNALLFLGEIPAAIECFDDLLAFSREHGDLTGEISALNKGGFVATVGTGDTDGAEAKLLEAKRLAEEAGQQAGVAEFHLGYCYLNVTRGRLDEAERHLGEAAEVCFTLDAHYRNFGLLHYAESLIYQARFDDARPALQRAREQAELDDDYEHLSGAIMADGLIALFTGRPEEAAQRAKEAWTMSARVGAAGSMTSAAWVGGMAAMALGDLEQARQHYRACVKYAPLAGNTGPGAVALVGLATIEQWLHGPDAPTVQDHLAEAREMAAMPVSQATATSIHANIGMDMIRKGDLEGADQELQAARATPSAMSKLSGPEVLLCGGGVALGRGRVEEAREQFVEAWDVIEQTGLDLYRARALLGLAIVADIDGDVDRMRDLLEQAEQDALDRLLRLDAITIQRTAIDLLSRHDLDTSDVRDRLGDTVAEIAARLDDRDTRRDFLRTNSAVG